MRILGIDPGLRLTGFGVIEQTGQKLAYVASGVVKSGDGDLGAMAFRVRLEGTRLTSIEGLKTADEAGPVAGS